MNIIKRLRMCVLTSDSHHKEIKHKLDNLHETRGAVASNSWGGSGVIKFRKLLEVADQRKPTNLTGGAF